jgi:hypothetical protein
MFPGTDLFVGIPFHAAHTILETGFLFYSALIILELLRKTILKKEV